MEKRIICREELQVCAFDKNVVAADEQEAKKKRGSVRFQGLKSVADEEREQYDVFIIT